MEAGARKEKWKRKLCKGRKKIKILKTQQKNLKIQKQLMLNSGLKKL